MQIGIPTDVKHVAHIGWDGPSASVDNAPSWMKEYKASTGGFQSAPLGEPGASRENPKVKWVSEGLVTLLVEAVPKKILELMNVPGLTRENVASHLQKYHLYLRRISGVLQQQNGFTNSFRGPPDVTFGSISSLNGLGLQALAASGQIPPQSLAAIQAATLGRVANKSAISVPLINQRNIFGYENQKLRFGDCYQQLNDNSKQMKLLHGIPTNMEPKQLATLHQSAEAFGNMQVQSQSSESVSLMTQLAQPLSRNQIINEINGSRVSGLSSSFGQPTLSQPNPSGVVTRSEIDNVCGAVYSSVSHPSAAADFSVNPRIQLPGNRFAPVSNPKLSTRASKGILQEEAKSDMKGTLNHLMMGLE